MSNPKIRYTKKSNQDNIIQDDTQVIKADVSSLSYADYLKELEEVFPSLAEYQPIIPTMEFVNRWGDPDAHVKFYEKFSRVEFLLFHWSLAGIAAFVNEAADDIMTEFGVGGE